MDVAPPHQPIHSWRDFLVHLLTITIGLFIALTLEASIESLHHRHLATALSILGEETRAAAPLEVARTPSGLTAAQTEALLIKSAEIDLSFASLETTMKALDEWYAAALTAH